jgi:hypothetical protein
MLKILSLTTDVLVMEKITRAVPMYPKISQRTFGEKLPRALSIKLKKAE